MPFSVASYRALSQHSTSSSSIEEKHNLCKISIGNDCPSFREYDVYEVDHKRTVLISVSKLVPINDKRWHSVATLCCASSGRYKSDGQKTQKAAINHPTLLTKAEVKKSINKTQYCVPAARFADAIAWCAISMARPRVFRSWSGL
jgi:hypothetical protein